MPDTQWIIVTMVVPAVIWLAKMARDGQRAFLDYLKEAIEIDKQERGRLRDAFEAERDRWREALDRNTDAQQELLKWLKVRNGGK